MVYTRVMTFLDTVIRTLAEQARKAYPSKKFRFGHTYIDDKEPVYQITMTAEFGNTGALFFCQGEGADTDAAAVKLVESFVAQVERDGIKQEAHFVKIQAAHTTAMTNYESARYAAVALLPVPTT